METLKLSEGNISECAARAAEVLRAGGVILYPTDTLYGLGADAFSDEAVAEVRRIKGRDGQKPMHCIVADTAMAERYAEFSPTARHLAEQFFSGPLTIVVEKRGETERGIARDIGTIGFRIPRNEFCIALAREFDKPYTTTSANVSGKESPRSVDEILAQLGRAAELIDLVIDAGILPKSAPSTVVGVSGTDVVVLREGAIPATDVWDALDGETRSKSTQQKESKDKENRNTGKEADSFQE